MKNYGRYKTTNSILAIYNNGKYDKIYKDVIPETVTLYEDYQTEGKHILEFKVVLKDEKVKEISYEVKSKTAFSIFPQWMERHISKDFPNGTEYVEVNDD